MLENARQAGAELCQAGAELCQAQLKLGYPSSLLSLTFKIFLSLSLTNFHLSLNFSNEFRLFSIYQYIKVVFTFLNN
jgi:hypothetical protein